MDSYYKFSLPPIGSKVIAYGAWVREHTPSDAVFAAGPESCVWIPALGGRRVLLQSDSRPPLDFDARRRAEQTLLSATDPSAILREAGRFGIGYLAVDSVSERTLGPDLRKRLKRVSVYEPVFANSRVLILRIRAR
jgi:hypothetical protein